MPMVDALLLEFDREMGHTRRVLERVPLQDGDWAPHQKSRTLRQLATHVAEIPRVGTRILTSSEWDRATSPNPQREPITDVRELLAMFDGLVTETRAALAGKSDGELMAPWTFKMAGREFFTIPRAGALRQMLFSHIIHHRAQLGVYLRLRDVPVPSTYGPSADEAV